MNNLHQKRFPFIGTMIAFIMLLGGGFRMDVFAASNSDETTGQETGTLRLIIRDAATRALVPCRVYLRNSEGESLRCDPLPFWHDHFTCEGVAELHPAAGEYTYEVEHGKEYRVAAGTVRVEKGIAETVTVELERIADMAAAGWYAGELHNHRTFQEMPLHMRAEDLYIDYVPYYWSNEPMSRNKSQLNREEMLIELDDGRFLFQNAYEDERLDGTVMFYNIFEPLEIQVVDQEMPPVVSQMEKAQAVPGSWIHVDRPYWWEYPAWLACVRVDSLEVINNNFWRHGFIDNEAWGRPRDQGKYPPPHGNALYCQDLYFHTLNSGFRIPPAAGSASGVPHTPVGYNRVYVQVEGKLTWDKWWDGLRAGRCFVSNGPLLQVKADGHWPGHVFSSAESLEMDLEMDLISRDEISRIEVICNGKVIRTLSADEWKNGEALGQVVFDQSGWFVVRALTAVEHTYRFAMTAPFYVEIGAEKNRISKSSVTLFRDWVKELQEREYPPAKKVAVSVYHDRALKFWEERLKEANAD